MAASTSASTNAGPSAFFGRGTLFQNAACLLCILFGLAMLANTQPAGDGVWFWYARSLQDGRHLYADMHLALQPLFVLETTLAMTLFGDGWLVSKIPAILHLVAYCVALLMLVQQSSASDLRKAILLGCAFFVSICFEAYRFDDYHVLADCFQLYSLLILLQLQKSTGGRALLLRVAALGVLSGLAITTRLNDGCALLVGVAFGLFCLAPARRAVSVLLFAAVAALTVVAVIKLTGDSLHDWARYSIFHAAGSKGGAGSVLKYPLHLPVNTWRWLRDPLSWQQIVFDASGAALAWAFLVEPLRYGVTRMRLMRAAVGTVLITLLVHLISYAFFGVELVMSFSAIGVLLLYALASMALVGCVRWLSAGGHSYQWNRREILLLVPLGQLASGSMSSGGVHMGLYGPIGVTIALLPIASPVAIKSEKMKSCLMAIAVLMLVNGAIYKTNIPYSWHSYQAKSLFLQRQWFRHPVYGPMMIDRGLLAMIQPVCAEIAHSNAHAELLSLPFPYANYFCNARPWHGYVQTFFDTSSKETIVKLMNELQTAPPQWIFYQRQLHTLKMHEDAYNHGKPLQQRYLDEMIERKLASGEWHRAYISDYESKPDWQNEWILIETVPARPPAAIDKT